MGEMNLPKKMMDAVVKLLIISWRDLVINKTLTIGAVGLMVLSKLHQRYILHGI